MREIIHQKQTQLDCVSTCMAMLAGLPRREVADRFHLRYLVECKIDVSDILWELQIPFRECRQEETILAGKLYVVSVPSINMETRMHLILVDWRVGKELKIFDPNRGVTGRRYYVTSSNPRYKNQVTFRGYHAEYEILD